MRTRTRLTLILVALPALAACGGDADEPASTLSRSEIDSVLAESPLPGAHVVGRALDVADTADARAARMDAAAR